MIAIAATWLALLAGSATLPGTEAVDSTLRCGLVTLAEVQAALGQAAWPLTPPEHEYTGETCSFAAGTAERRGILEVSVFLYPTSKLADSAFILQFQRNRANPAIRWRQEPALGARAFSEISGEPGKELAWLDVVEGKRRLMVQLQGAPGNREEIAKLLRNVAERAWAREGGRRSRIH